MNHLPKAGFSPSAVGVRTGPSLRRQDACTLPEQENGFVVFSEGTLLWVGLNGHQQRESAHIPTGEAGHHGSDDQAGGWLPSPGQSGFPGVADSLQPTF